MVELGRWLEYYANTGDWNAVMNRYGSDAHQFISGMQVALDATSGIVSDGIAKAMAGFCIEALSDRLGLTDRLPARVPADTKEQILKTVDEAVTAGLSHTWACACWGVSDDRVHRWRARLRDVGTLVDRAPGGNPVHHPATRWRPSWPWPRPGDRRPQPPQARPPGLLHRPGLGVTLDVPARLSLAAALALAASGVLGTGTASRYLFTLTADSSLGTRVPGRLVRVDLGYPVRSSEQTILPRQRGKRSDRHAHSVGVHRAPVVADGEGRGPAAATCDLEATDHLD